MAKLKKIFRPTWKNFVRAKSSGAVGTGSEQLLQDFEARDRE
jgi:hypothetical protein